MEVQNIHDIVIVGGGAAGLRAALAAAEKNPKLSIALISKVYPVRSHTVSAEGGMAGVMRDDDSLESHAFDTIKGSDFLADQDAVEFFVKEAPREITDLANLGCPFSREENGDVAVRAFGGMTTKRTVYAADKTGFYLLHSLFERSLKYENIVRYDEWFVTRLIVKSSRCIGLIALSQKDGRCVAFSAKAVILATGGAGKIFKFTTNGNIKTGDGMALAYKAGAALKDMEFVQFHPTGLVRTGILITEGARGEGGYLVNKTGERFLQRYLPSKMELGPRDMISRAIISEFEAGNGIETKDGLAVHLDLRHLGEKKIDERLPLVREISQEFAGLDPVKEPIPVRPVMHYFMGGVHTDINGATTIEGLFAAGEVACVTINGANRLGSNSLSECLVFGRVAGERAAMYAETARQTVPESAVMHDEERRLDDFLAQSGTERIALLRTEMQSAMDAYAGIIRSRDKLEKGIEKIGELRERFKNIGLDDHSHVFNTEFIGCLELESMLFVAMAVLESALRREESRGSHFRSDFEKRDDERFLKHQLVQCNGHDMIFKDAPVVITKWPPQARTY